MRPDESFAHADPASRGTGPAPGCVRSCRACGVELFRTQRGEWLRRGYGGRTRVVCLFSSDGVHHPEEGK